MINSLIVPLLMLSAQAETPIVSHQAEAYEVYRCDFEAESDRNYDSWPDDWTRRKGRGHPFYLPVAITKRSDLSGAPRALKIELDGGAAVLYSPRIPINPDFSYILQLDVKTENLRHDVAYCAVTFFDGDQRRLESFTSEHTQTESWTRVEIGPLTPRDQRALWANIELHLEPTEKADLVGSAWFDDIWLGRLPRMSITAEKRAPYNVFTDPTEVRINCRVSGFSEADPMLTFELLDVEGSVVATEKRPIQDLERPKKPPARPTKAGAAVLSGTAGMAQWSPPIKGNGFYRVRAFLPGKAGKIIERSAKLVVVTPQTTPKHGEFGWSIPRGDDPLTIGQLETLLPQTGIHWIKFPVWYSDLDKGRADELALFAEHVNSNQIQLVGLLDRPPSDLRHLFGPKGHLPIASVFVDPEVWRPAIDTVMTRLSLKVRWWQLGSDTDTSFVNYPNLEEKIRGISNDLNRFGQETNLGIALRSTDQTPKAENPPWSFLSHVADPPLTAAELDTYFTPEDGDSTAAKRWLVLEPLPKRSYDLQTRATDLVQRMIAAKKQDVAGIFVPNPFDAQTGLMDVDGSPAELLLAWRTTALMISGAHYLGSITMPSGSSNHIFVRGKEAVMAVWNDQATEEVIYLGENIRHFDIWGREQEHSEVAGDIARHAIQVNQLPSFITGVDPGVASWRMGFEFETKRLASVFGQPQTAWYGFSNSFDHGVVGSVQINTRVVPDPATTETKFKLADAEETRKPLHVTLGANINSGPQPVRVDFNMRPHRFSVYRTIQVGLGDVEFELSSRIDEDGNLVVEQRLTNKTDKFVGFNCMLFAKDRKRKQHRIRNLSKGTITNEFVFPAGEDLVGTSLTLRAEEIDGVRVLNHHHVANR